MDLGYTQQDILLPNFQQMKGFIVRDDGLFNGVGASIEQFGELFVADVELFCPRGCATTENLADSWWTKLTAASQEEDVHIKRLRNNALTVDGILEQTN